MGSKHFLLLAPLDLSVCPGHMCHSLTPLPSQYFSSWSVWTWMPWVWIRKIPRGFVLPLAHNTLFFCLIDFFLLLEWPRGCYLMTARKLQGSAKRQGCLLSYSQAEPGRESTQPSPCLLAKPCRASPQVPSLWEEDRGNGWLVGQKNHYHVWGTPLAPAMSFLWWTPLFYCV